MLAHRIYMLIKENICVKNFPFQWKCAENYRKSVSWEGSNQDFH